MLIEGKEISLVYDMDTDQEMYALKDIDIILSPGKIVSLIGPSGSGKSSLLYVLAGLRRPTTGTVYYDDVDIEALSASESAVIRKNRFGFIFQRHFLIDYLNVINNILTAVNRNDRQAHEKAEALADRLGIRHLLKKKICALSVGQRQRVAVARALMNEPSVIFADEPTASLDQKNAVEVMELLSEVKSDAAILIVTHDRSILKYADQIKELRDGRFI